MKIRQSHIFAHSRESKVTLVSDNALAPNSMRSAMDLKGITRSLSSLLDIKSVKNVLNTWTTDYHTGWFFSNSSNVMYPCDKYH